MLDVIKDSVKNQEHLQFDQFGKEIGERKEKNAKVGISSFIELF